jgi:hypothetical protein
MPPRRKLLSLILVCTTLVAGLMVRFAPLSLPRVLVKYGGSVLWALMIYWIVSALLASWRIPIAAGLAGILATAVEFMKLYHSPGLDAFRHTLPGILLLGRVFSGWDIAAYWIGICIGAAIDEVIRKPPTRA